MLNESFVGSILGILVFVIFLKKRSSIQRIRITLEPYLGRVLSNAVIGFFMFAIGGMLASIFELVFVDLSSNFIEAVKGIAIATLVSGIVGLILIAVVAAITKENL